MVLRQLCALASVLLLWACAPVILETAPAPLQHHRLFEVQPEVHGTARICFPAQMRVADDPDELIARNDCLYVGQLRFLLYGDLDVLEDDAKTWIERIRAEAQPGVGDGPPRNRIAAEVQLRP